MSMKVRDAFEKAVHGDRLLTIYADFNERRIAAQGLWYMDQMMDYMNQYADAPVELIGEGLKSVTVALKTEDTEKGGNDNMVTRMIVATLISLGLGNLMNKFICLVCSDRYKEDNWR